MTKTAFRVLIGVGFCCTLLTVACAEPPTVQPDSLREELAAIAGDGHTYAPTEHEAAETAIDAYQAEMNAQHERLLPFRSYTEARALAEAAELAVDDVREAASTEKERQKTEAEQMISQARSALTEARQMASELPPRQAAAIEASIMSASKSIDQVDEQLAGGDVAAAHQSSIEALQAAKGARTSLAAALSELEETRETRAKRQTRGIVDIPRPVLANGERLAAGSYEIRLADGLMKKEAPAEEKSGEGSAPVARSSGQSERWLEFVSGGRTVGRALTIVVSAEAIDEIAESAKPPTGESRVDVLKSGDYVRVWLNRNGVHYLAHLPIVSK